MVFDPLKIAMQVGDQVKKKPLIYLKSKDALAADVVTDAPFGLVTDELIVSRITLLAGEAIAAGGAYATFTVKYFLAGVEFPIATISTQAGVAKMTPSQGSLLLTTIPVSAVLAVQISKSGGGVVLPACMVVVDTNPSPPST